MSKHIAARTPTQVAHPGKAALRTAVAYTLAAISFLALAIPIITDTLGDYLPDSWEAWLTGAVVFLVAVATLITRLMALAKAQDFLAKIGLGTGVEKEAPAYIAPTTDGDEDQATPEQRQPIPGTTLPHLNIE